MSRIRSIHPGFWTDEAFAALSDAAALFYIGLLNESDDQGVFEWKPLTLRMRLRPSKDGDVGHLLTELEARGAIRRYELGGRQYGAVRNFRKYQRPKKPKTVHPITPEIGTYLGSSAPSGEPEDDEAPPVPQKGEKSPQMEEGGGKGRRDLDLGRSLNLDPEFGVSSEIVAGLVKGAVRKAEKSNYVWLKDTDTRIPRAQAWWREHYGGELQPQHRGNRQGFNVPWEAVR